MNIKVIAKGENGKKKSFQTPIFPSITKEIIKILKIKAGG
jgi:hypothetical protein